VHDESNTLRHMQFDWINSGACSLLILFYYIDIVRDKIDQSEMKERALEAKQAINEVINNTETGR